MLVAVATSPLVVNTKLSAERCVPPAATSLAPPVPEELSHPRPLPPGGFEQGHVIQPSTPGSQRLVKSGPSRRSRTNTSYAPFVSPPMRFVAVLSKAMHCPSAEIVGV